MLKEEAIRLVQTAYPGKDIGTVTETDKYFLVSLIPKMTNSRNVMRLNPYNDGLKAVDKATKKVFTYNPIRH